MYAATSAVNKLGRTAFSRSTVLAH